MPILAASTPTPAHAVTLAAYKALAIKCAIEFSGADLRRPPAYLRMDPSEKGNISYWTGMMFAALIADELLKVPRLVHAGSLARARLARVTATSRRLADLVGKDDAGNWHVVEAKARQAPASWGQRADWKAQAQAVATIDGAVPATRSYCLSLVRNIYGAEVVDPPSQDRDVPPLTISFVDGGFQDGYYRPLLTWLEEDANTVRRAGQEVLVKLAGYDAVDREYLHLGLLSRLKASLKGSETVPELKGFEDDDSYMGSDGIVLITSPRPELR